jgi:hypothetical protein
MQPTFTTVHSAALQAVFEGGDYCHKHPARSLRVKLECGGEERGWDASEPNTCAYQVYASTPAACKAEKLKELQVGCCNTHATRKYVLAPAHPVCMQSP